jgi:hypothetical protein
MLYEDSNLDEIIDRMRGMGDILIPYNFPNNHSYLVEEELAIFKEREVIIDGIPLFLNYQKSDYKDYFVETVQIFGKNSPFLPFNIVCKIGKRFLGGHHLSLVEVFKDNRKIYIWSVCVDERGRPIALHNDIKTEQHEYEGFIYQYLQPNQIDFY